MRAAEMLREASRRMRDDHAGDDSCDGRTLLAVADWLDEEASQYEARDFYVNDRATDVARAFLGETS